MSVSVNNGTVLYAEDEPSDRLFMDRAFRKAGLGHALRTVVNGQEAKDYLAGKGAYGDRSQHPMPAVVLLDLKMPLVDGFELLEWMRGRSELTSLPVVVFTSSPLPVDQQRAKDLGANDYIEKPSAVSKFGDVVKRLREKWLA